ncbi:pitrilysin family protein [soil metagenome]
MLLTRLPLLALPLVLAGAPLTQPPPVAPPPVAAAPAPASSFGLSVDTLDNGLTLVTIPMPGTGVVAFYTLVKAGSRDEVESGRSGYAHLFEHLMFRGTQKIPAADYERRMQAMGSDNNAFTTDDFTLFTPLIPKESLGELVPVEADRFAHLDVSQNAFKDETGAVNGEFAKDFSNPWWLMDEQLRDLAFKKHTYGHTTIGYKRDVEGMAQNYAYSKTFFSRFYTPDDCVIWAVGDVERARALELVKQSYGTWSGKRAEPKIEVEPDQKEARTRELVWKGPTTPRLTIGYKIPAVRSGMGDSAALAVLSVLAFGEPSDLYQKLIVKDQKLIELGADPDEALHKDAGLLRVDAKLKDGTSFDDITASVQATLDAIGRGESKPVDIDAARSHLVSALTLSMQTPSAVAERFAYLAAVTGDVHGYEKYLDALKKVTPEDVTRVAKTYLVPTRRNVVTLAPPAASAKKEAK